MMMIVIVAFEEKGTVDHLWITHFVGRRVDIHYISI
jgi:hypothetical protein